MAYQALYRVYRPRTFDDMVGQEVITQTLKNAIETHQTGHAYLFSGPRGTGKTSAAKIFAREVNGIDAATDDSQIPDIIEFDAASNSRVEDIRDILTNVDYAPLEAAFKIYIIDEVHMLSNSAFNALLKTLEEPPVNVKFILATTEPQKVPVTILSRTQRFEFKRIGSSTIQKRLAEILTKQNVKYEEGALRIIANVAEGGMRDALSILDQVIAFGADIVTIDNALQVTGSTTTKRLLTYLQQVSGFDTQASLKTLHDILLEGKDAQRFVADVLGLLRDVMLADVAPELIKSTIALTELQALTQQLGTSRIQKMMMTLDDIQKQLMQTMQSDIYLELLTVKLSMNPTQSSTIDNEPIPSSHQAVKEVQQVDRKPEQQVEKVSTTSSADKRTVSEEKISEPVPINDNSNGNVQTQTSSQKLIARTGQQAVFAVLKSAKRESLTRIKENWATLIGQFDVTQQAMLTIAEPVAASDEAVVLAFDYPALLVQALQDTTLQSQLNSALRDQSLPAEMVLISQDDWHQERAAYVKQLKAGTVPDVKLADVARVSGPLQKEATLSDVKLSDKITSEPTIVAEAKKLFGDDIVTVVD
ncbi:DNA polymerase III subunit gamma/tau [Leuconostoc carnosum]|mgnify:CR=1 FL=1|uniref:DNA-directed DNA polymerase n=2 Tax=Leuconostoc carnosum TaxID=1252 RepID=K0D8J2_LEUCJ|nr:MULTISPECIES: DNA polymerase III subunit gamma/tau [Leuconostoc]AFT81148.1 DNA polymerase III subunits gamma and tau [Leuconostoc carnosum JB16]KAA8326487.1 DNA polymerase III subunit gamma/tau [Leuconostoc carnosum]KAA8330745.1 DNA polymerase III subunit gamma/tau [Leuconostoc carnosum]KAA8362047.1 DNA polymerase III subunit gamma/tau [Leuconostoc carnosum]KAA8366595.1 DNA polymerase III subunit gamma/tau [Leuconostoc carnosum]